MKGCTRRRKTGVPKNIKFNTKPQIAAALRHCQGVLPLGAAVLAAIHVLLGELTRHRIVFFVIPVLAAMIPVIGFALSLYRWLHLRRSDRLAKQ